MGRLAKPETIAAAYERGKMDGYRQGIQEMQNLADLKARTDESLTRFKWYTKGKADGISEATETAADLFGKTEPLDLAALGEHLLVSAR